ncbi:MAG: response regulator [Spirochaetia bacterium]|jgi:two-component system response regulator YesN|nr:response regulator [Spirochaetia bacterium]
MARILIADDEDLERRALGLIISEASKGEPCSIEEAKNGHEALAIGLHGDFDVIFLDIKMPGMDGIGVAEGLRKANIQSAIVIVSAYDTFEYAQKAIRLGVYEYLLKPASREEVLEALARSLKLQREPDSLARLRRESVSALSTAMERLEAQLVREMERGEALAATAADFERLASLEGLARTALVFRLDSGGAVLPSSLANILSGMVFDEASNVFASADRILRAKTGEGGCLLVYGSDPSGIETRSTGGEKKASAGCSKGSKANFLGPLIRAAEEKLKSQTSCSLFWGCSGPSAGEQASLLVARAFEACRLAHAEYPFVCLGSLNGEKNDVLPKAGVSDKARPGLALRALDALKQDCARDWSLETLAQELNASPFHLSHLLSRELGMGFSELLQRLRIRKAKEILAGGASAKEAGYLVGFSDQAYFTRVFKKLEGRTPGEYQDETAKKYQ